VFLAYASVHGYALLDRRLYLPQDWFEEAYAERRRACGVPHDVTFSTKPLLALAMIQQAVASGSLPCQWVCGDEAFGDCPALLDGIAALSKWYFAEVAHDTRVWCERPATAVPPWSGRGRKPTKVQVAVEAPAAVTVAALAAGLDRHAWQRYTIKHGSQGPLVADFAFVRVVGVREGLPGPDVWLVLRRSVSDGELKAYLSNAPQDLAVARLVRVSGRRWPIESSFEVGKQALGMGDYDMRSWRGWHHHMTLVLLAMGFLVRLQGRFSQTLHD
jgi:SRSO17 transposase